MATSDFLQDLRYALRVLRRDPAFVVTAVASLAIGVGVVLGVLAFANILFLRPLPCVFDGAALVAVFHHPRNRGEYQALSYADYQYYREHSQVFSELAAFSTWPMVVRAGNAFDEVEGELVSPTYFSTLGLQPAAGRLLSSDDARVDANSAVVLSHSYWRHRFGGEVAAIGRVIRVGQASCTIVGVTPKGFQGLSAEASPAIWVSVGSYRRTVARLASAPGGSALLTGWGNRSFSVVGRLRPGLTVAAAQRHMSSLARRIAVAYPERAAIHGSEAPPDAVVISGSKARISPESRPDALRFLLLLGVTAAFVFLAASLNVSSLIMARTAQRLHELALRVALGAGPGRVTKQLLTENLLIVGVGTALGFFVANWTVALLSRTGPGFGLFATWSVNGAIDPTVATAGAAVAVLTGSALTLIPYRFLRSPQLSLSLPVARQRGTRVRIHRTLVGMQIALSVVLVMAAGLFLQTLHNARTTNTMTRPEEVLLGKLDLSGTQYADASRAARLYSDLVDRVRALTGVREAALVMIVPHSGRRGGATVEVDAEDGDRSERQVGFNIVSPEYFGTAGLPLLAGRCFSRIDTAGTPPVALINDVMAQRYFAGRSPLGRRLLLKWPPANTVEIIGVVRDGGKWRYRSEGEPVVYVPVGQRPISQMTLILRTSGNAEAFLPAVRRELMLLDHELVLTEAQTARSRFDSVLARERVVAFLLSTLAAVATLLSAVGVFGLVSYTVSRRTREFGVRLAVGATPWRVVAAVLVETVRLTSVGVIGGTIAALGLIRGIQRLLFGVTPAEPRVLVVTVCVFLLVALLAGYLPARRAASVDPIVAIRTE